MLWRVGRSGQHNNRVSVSNTNGIWKCIRGMPGNLVHTGIIINSNVREIQIWDTTINLEGIIEAIINCHIIVFFHLNGIVPDFL